MAHFERKYNRSVSDIGKNMIQPRAKRLVEGAVQFFGNYCRKNHTWRNRTGALENSISWSQGWRTRRGWRAQVEAGGESIAKYTYDYGIRKGSGKRKANIVSGRVIKAGDRVNVNYAHHVQNKGHGVLKQGEEPTRQKFRRLGVRIMRLPNSPRV